MADAAPDAGFNFGASSAGPSSPTTAPQSQNPAGDSGFNFAPTAPQVHPDSGFNFGASSQPDTPSNPALNGLSPDTQKMLKQTTQKISGFSTEGLDPSSLVGKAMAGMDAVSYPVNLVYGLGVKAAAMAGVPGAEALRQKIDPNNTLLPAPHFHDISDFIYDKATLATGAGLTGTLVRDAINVAKPLTAFIGDTASNPLTYLGIAEPTKSALELQKVGDYSNPAATMAKDPLTVGAPFGIGGRTALITSEQMAKGIQAVSDSPVGQAAKAVVDSPVTQAIVNSKVAQFGTNALSTGAKALRALSPNTGNPEIDYALNTHNALTKGADNNVVQGMVSRVGDLGITPDEARLTQALDESTPNFKGNLPDEIVSAAKPGLLADETTIRGQARAQIGDAAQKMGITLAPGRDEAVINALMESKSSGARYSENLADAGHITEDNVNEKMIENHSPHVRSPQYNDDPASDVIEKTQGKYLQTKDPTRQRSINGTVADINSRIETATGKKGFFIEDPIIARAVREKVSQKVLRDGNASDVIAKYGVPDSLEARKAGLVPINHPDFTETRSAIPGATSTDLGRVVRHPGLLFTPDIAEKVNGYMGVRAVGDVQGGLQQFAEQVPMKAMRTQNAIMKSQVFTSPGIWIRNGISNLVKGLSQGVGPSAWLKELDSMMGSAKTEMSAPNLLNPKGKFWSDADFQKVFQDYGVEKGAGFREGDSLMKYLDSTRDALTEQVNGSANGYAKNAANYAKSALNTVAKYGEKGEIFARKAFIRQKILDGYEPSAAVDLMTKVMFDYNRQSPAGRVYQTLVPFAQHGMKTVEALPRLVGANPGLWPALQTTAPRIIANLMSDPMQQHALNQILPAWIKNKDPICGPHLGANSWLAQVFGATQANSKGGSGMQMYFTPDIGLEVANNANPMSASYNSTLSGITQAFFTGKDALTGKEIPDNKTFNDKAWNAIGMSIRGTVAMNNMDQAVKQAMGWSNPDLYETNTSLLRKAVSSQFGGAIPIDQDADMKISLLGHALIALKESAKTQLFKEKQGLGNPGSLSTFMSQRYGIGIPATNAQIYHNTVATLQNSAQSMVADRQQTSLAKSLLSGQLDAGAYRAATLNLEQNIRDTNQNLQFWYSNYLRLSSGAKNPQEARAKAGIGQ